MSVMPISIHYHSGELFAVPAIHFSHVFAREVNRICSSPETQPDAIAVELGPQTAAAAKRWLKDLWVGREIPARLPVMLGLIRRNRVIRLSFRKKAFQLQQETRKDLSEFPPDVLYRELGYAGYALLCMPPTDSIIEAIRCAVELDLPLYGVDLQEMANSKYKPVLLQDPIGAKRDFVAYIAQNAPYAAHQRDDESDVRREIAMAARLKALLGRHRRVLFTCGMAHWSHIGDLLEDRSVRPSQLPEVTEVKQGEFTRVVIHPLIAISHMDLFPALVGEYEKSRKPPHRFDENSRKKTDPDPARIFEKLLRKTYRGYFRCKKQDSSCAQRSRDLASHRDFEAYLRNLCIIKHRLVPDLFMTIRAAQQTMSRDFARALSKTLMHFPWASPDEYPDCSVLAPCTDHGDRSICTVFSNSGLKDKKYICIQPIHESSNDTITLEIPYEWEKTKRLRRALKDHGILHTWIPWDYLISALSLRGISHARKMHYERRSQVFEGSILEGIDIKATLRGYSRGKEEVYVRDTLKKKSRYLSHPGDGFPVVWILKPGEHRGAEWTALYEDCDWMAKYIEDLNRFERIRKMKGNKMIALIGYGDLQVRTRASDANPGIRSDRYYGMLMYQPICFTKRQFARWAELTGYKRNPFCERNILGVCALSDLIDFFEETHGIRMGEFNWSTTLILFAITFAKDAVTVVIPENYQIDPVVFEKAKRYGIEVCPVPLTVFSQREIERVSLNHMAPALTCDPRCVFSKSVEKAIGESQADNRNLVPQSWLDFGMN